MYIYLLIGLAFAADRLSKWWAASYLAEHGTTHLNRFLTIRESYNRGVVFGLFQGAGPLIGWLSLFILLVLVLYLRQLPRSAWLPRIGLALVIGGALGNLVDRITAGQVLDFLATPLPFGIFNVADLLINGGVLLFGFGLLLQETAHG
jgi:signal peptidase II